MLSTKENKLKRISLNGISFDKSFEDDKDMIENYLQKLNWNSTVLDSLSIGNCSLSDDLFSPIVNVLKLVKTIDLDGNELTLKSLYVMLKVCLI